MGKKQWKSPVISFVSVEELNKVVGVQARSCWFKFFR